MYAFETPKELNSDTQTAPQRRSRLWRILRLLAASPIGFGLMVLTSTLTLGCETLPTYVQPPPVEEVVPFAAQPVAAAPAEPQPAHRADMPAEQQHPLPGADPRIELDLDQAPERAATPRQVSFPDESAEEGGDVPASTDPEIATPCDTDLECPTLANGCIVRSCNEAIGLCQEVAFVCQCVPGQSGSCDDNNPCTEDTCSEVGACAYDSDAVCSDGNACTEDSCEAFALTGQAASASCSHVTMSDQDCEDGDPCTEASVCDAGTCTATQGADCDDNDPCTFDICQSGQGCEHIALPSCGG